MTVIIIHRILRRVSFSFQGTLSEEIRAEYVKFKNKMEVQVFKIEIVSQEIFFVDLYSFEECFLDNFSREKFINWPFIMI
ncbi:hypothetical protein BpHYR1_010397 [Brachionus plicatilis]|uniref:Uncharacterized protein n=1 Tax=Brachionus plicatilis TaxID=10195 RepID=A0A3M7RDK9_BRAPC|nr:hypothetical protein BpHYR1_010397 [Brachionus plicatilis]